VLFALHVGYRHLDTALSYGNAACLGAALAESGLDREEVFIATKLHPDSAGDILASPGWESMLTKHLAELRTSYVDALMLHFPAHSEAATLTMWGFLERCHREGRARALGVSNFRVEELQALWERAIVRPSFQQIRWSLYEPAESELSSQEGELAGEDVAPARGSLIAWAADHGLRTVVFFALSAAAFPLPVLEDPHVVALAREHHCTPAQVILRYLFDLGFIVLVQAVMPEHAGQNVLAVECAVPRWELWRLTGLAGLAHENGAGWGGEPHFVADVFGLRAGLRWQQSV